MAASKVEPWITTQIPPAKLSLRLRLIRHGVGTQRHVGGIVVVAVGTYYGRYNRHRRVPRNKLGVVRPRRRWARSSRMDPDERRAAKPKHLYDLRRCHLGERTRPEKPGH